MSLADLIRAKNSPGGFANANLANPANPGQSGGLALATLATLALANPRSEKTEGAEADIAEAIKERAAIMEVDGGLSRGQAQAVAAMAGNFYRHHWNCAACRAGTQVGSAVHQPCTEGADLWRRYAEAAGREVHP